MLTLVSWRDPPSVSGATLASTCLTVWAGAWLAGGGGGGVGFVIFIGPEGFSAAKN